MTSGSYSRNAGRSRPSSSLPPPDAAARTAGVAGRVATLKLKTADFRGITRRRTLPVPTQAARTLFSVARELLAAEAKGRAYRLIGAGLSDLVDAAAGLDMFAEDERRARRSEQTIDAVRARFGAGGASRARGFGCRGFGCAVCGYPCFRGARFGGAGGGRRRGRLRFARAQRRRAGKRAADVRNERFAGALRVEKGGEVEVAVDPAQRSLRWTERSASK